MRAQSAIAASHASFCFLVPEAVVRAADIPGGAADDFWSGPLQGLFSKRFDFYVAYSESEEETESARINAVDAERYHPD
eukprot:scaffold28118_cov70-Phaeocystis_antarctica.AAC.6